MMTDRVGQQFGNYRLLRLLGRGGFADVYLGEHVYLKSQAAIKLLHLQLTEETAQQFLQEAQTLARLSHPHIVRLLDFAVQEDLPFLVMDYVPGGTLRTRYPKETHLPLGTIAAYVTQVASALQYAHDQHLIHRDIKPENMLLDARSEVLLSDFGLAMLVQESRSYSTQVPAQPLAGTASYLAPEQIQGQPRPASDQYALGIVVYEWLCGTPPFHGTPLELAMQHLSAPPPPLRLRLPDLSPTVEAVVLRALAKDPEQRFACVNDFVAAFQEAVELPLGVFASDTGGADADAKSGPAAAPRQGVQDDPLHHLLISKLQIPRLRTRLVTRSHLTQRLQQGMEQAVTLISAPAGFGKTTLLAQWIAAPGLPVAYLSLEPEDNDPVRFLSYLIAAVQRVDAHLGATALARLGTPQPPPPETVMALLSNDLMRSTTGEFALVLDDYHVITAEPIHRALTSLVEHLPPQMHLLIATRADPPLPLARLRARGQLTELRAAELRFGAAEASAFLEEVMGLHLAQEDVTTLQTRTEGWIAGLQLAALSLQGRANASDVLSAFSGSHRFVLDYLSEEVLSRQPAAVQTFLLSTSVLSRLSGSLCDTVTGHGGSQAMLEALEQANLFVAALDDERGWYRYHPLFADLLRSRLHQTMPALVPDLHRRASSWYEQQDLIVEAVHHALLSPEVESSIRLIEQHTHSLALRGQVQTALHWLHAFPDGLVRTHPHLCFSYALLLMFSGQLAEALLRLQDAEQSASDITLADEAQALLHQVAIVRAYILFLQGHLATSVALAEQVLERLSETPVQGREAASVIVAHRFLVSGDVRRVEELRVAQLASSLGASSDVFAMEVLVHLTSILLQARMLRLQGRLRQAAAIYEQMRQVQGGQERSLIHPGYCFGLGELCYEWNDLDAAERLLEQGMEVLGGPLTLTADSIAQGYATLACLHQARNKPTLALALVEAFARLSDARQFAPAPLAFARAVRAQLELMGGHLAAAVRWTEASGLEASGDLAYPREREYLTFARVRIAQGREEPAGPFLSEALRLLERMREDAEAKARMGSTLEILILQALAFSAQGKGTEALTVIERALTQAEPEGYIRLFVDEGEPMVALLRQAYAHGIAPGYVAILLSAAGAPALAAPSPAGSLLEPLTERELDVLRLLVAGLSNAAMARELIITVGTVKSHVNHIYGKLGVQSRSQAIARAHTLHLL
jgi:LuxR family transcriptional regulator, maltose regulon positive regulatory protein